MSTDKIYFLDELVTDMVIRTEWKLTREPYPAPVYLAQKLGYFADEAIEVALLEPNDLSGLLATTQCQFFGSGQEKTDLTEIIGSGKVGMGFKAMIHTSLPKLVTFL